MSIIIRKKHRPCFIMSTAIWALAVSTPSQRPLATCPRYLPAPLPSLPTMVRGRGQPAARGKGAKGGKGYHQKGAKGVWQAKGAGGSAATQNQQSHRHRQTYLYPPRVARGPPDRRYGHVDQWRA